MRIFPFKLAQYLSYLLNKSSSTPCNENKIQKHHCDQGQSHMMINDSQSFIMQDQITPKEHNLHKSSYLQHESSYDSCILDMSSVMLVMWCFRSLNIRYPRPGNPVVWLIHPQLKSRQHYSTHSCPRLIHSHLHATSAASVTGLMSFRLLEPVMALQRDRPMNTLDLTSMDPQLAPHPLLKHSSTSSSYLIFLSWASSIRSLSRER